MHHFCLFSTHFVPSKNKVLSILSAFCNMNCLFQVPKFLKLEIFHWSLASDFSVQENDIHYCMLQFVYLALIVLILNMKPFSSISMMLCYSKIVLSIFATTNHSLHGNYSLHGNPILPPPPLGLQLALRIILMLIISGKFQGMENTYYKQIYYNACSKSALPHTFESLLSSDFKSNFTQ